ncbi:hypothetical protein OHU34_41920 [Streptomyces sp. NBC_00080]|uniref:hypothetical protein n=1 Tax=Streptomyces TaxID=1883 RepID=UPI001150F40F|nr:MULTISPECIES: hypothetical protein [Streptomyces]TQJ46365.1 hypothetical protein FBY34_5747 [Streptomyces sp. SLBN-115]
MNSIDGPTFAVSRRSVLAAGALTAAAVVHQSVRAPAASAAAEPAIFYSPHQDDDAIGLGTRRT